MPKYFKHFPNTFYSSNNNTSGVDIVTNIMVRFAFEKKLKENTLSFYKYDIQDLDTPEIIASKYYGNPERHWIVLAFNDIVDPQHDWPLDSRTLINYIDAKYSSNGANNSPVQTGITWAQSTNNVQAYYKIITRTSPDETVIIEKIEVDANTYANVTATSTSITLDDSSVITQDITKEQKTYYDYEIELNEDKRKINLLKPEFVNSVEKELKRVLR